MRVFMWFELTRQLCVNVCPYKATANTTRDQQQQQQVKYQLLSLCMFWIGCMKGVKVNTAAKM